MQKIIDGTAPDRFSQAHLKSIGFKSSNDQGIIPVLKALGFLSADGAPSQRYLAYRDRTRSRSVLGEALRENYGDLFHINESLSESDRDAVEGKFKSVHNSSDRVAQLQAMTFFALLALADPKAKAPTLPAPPASIASSVEDNGSRFKSQESHPHSVHFSGLRYNIEIHLPATKEIEVYNAIFKSIAENLLND